MVKYRISPDACLSIVATNNVSTTELESGLGLKGNSGVAPVLHILVVGFHHQKGCSLEYVYPPFAACVSPASSLTSQLPKEWRHLPHLALPEGCHNYDEDTSFFVLPSQGASDSNQAVYGIACCRQMDSKEVDPSGGGTSRSTIQKSVCVLSKYPYYVNIEAKINLVTQAYFEAKNFSVVTILQDTLGNLNSSLLSRSPPISLHMELTQQAQVLKLGHHLLQIVKALLLQKRVLLCGLPAKMVCKGVLSILSLFPKSAEALACPGQTEPDECGFPLKIFVSPFSVQPYMCLQQMDMLANENEHLLIGVTNPLFQKQHSKFCDLYVNLETGLVDISDPKLRTSLYLTTADLRFCDYMSESVQEALSNTTANISHWFGSDEWVRSQYRLYMVSLLATSLSSHEENLLDFGEDFVDTWQKGSVYTSWKLASVKHSGMAEVEPLHLCRGDLTFNDLKLRLSAQATDYGMSEKSREKMGKVLQQTREVARSVGGAVSSVTGAVGGVWGAASSAVSSWWWTGEED